METAAAPHTLLWSTSRRARTVRVFAWTIVAAAAAFIAFAAVAVEIGTLTK